MKVGEILKELSEHPEKREDLLGSVVGDIIVLDAFGRTYVMNRKGFEDLVRIGDVLFSGRIPKEKWLDFIEYNLREMNEDVEPYFNAVLPDMRPFEPIKFDLKDIKLPEIVECVIEEPMKEPVPPYRPKMKPFDKRRNYKPKNFWNRIRSRCK